MPQPAENVPQVASVKRQATWNKGLDLLTLIKFHGLLFKSLDYDEGVQWMSFMEANLMGWEANFLTQCNFKFKCKKEMIFIIYQ